MKPQFLCLFILILSPLSFAEENSIDDVPQPDVDPTPDDPAEGDSVLATDDQLDFNDRLDEIIKDTIKNHRSEINPLVLNDQFFYFNKTFGVGLLEKNVTGKAGLTNITLEGLENIRRIGNASLAKTKYGNTEMRLNLALGPLHLTMEGIASLLGLGAKMAAEGNVAHVDGKAILHYYPSREEIYVKSFTLGNLNGLNFKIIKSPLFFTPFIVNQFLRVSLATFNPLIKSAAERVGSRILSQAIRESDFVKDIMTKHAAK
jgi:hypothetical protein